MSEVFRCNGECKTYDIDCCSANSPTEDEGWECSRPKGHDGPHVACGFSECNFCIWDDEGKILKYWEEDH